jgi:hypothetical protein
VVIVGYPLFFAKLWNCAHRSAEFAPCTPYEGLTVLFGILVVAMAVFGLVKWAFDRGDNQSDN